MAMKKQTGVEFASINRASENRTRLLLLCSHSHDDISPTLAERIHGCGTGCRASIFSSPGRSPGRAIVLASATALAFYVKNFYVMGKALSGELSCPCDRSCFFCKISSVPQ